MHSLTNYIEKTGAGWHLFFLIYERRKRIMEEYTFQNKKSEYETYTQEDNYESQYVPESKK